MKLNEAQVSDGLKRLPGWTRTGDTIEKAFVFKKFADGIAFVGRVAKRADAADHHPDIDIRYTTVKLALSTHSAGGLTQKDLDLAGEIDSSL